MNFELKGYRSLILVGLGLLALLLGLMINKLFSEYRDLSIVKDTIFTGRDLYQLDVKNKEVLNKNYTIVNSVLISTDQRPEVKINWRVYTKNPDNPLIRDLIIEGLSLARTQKEEFASILNSNNGDIDALFEVLENFSKN